MITILLTLAGMFVLAYFVAWLCKPPTHDYCGCQAFTLIEEMHDVGSDSGVKYKQCRTCFNALEKSK